MGLVYESFSTPAVHIKNVFRDIFQGLGLCPWGTSDYEVFKAVARVASNLGVGVRLSRLGVSDNLKQMLQPTC